VRPGGVRWGDGDAVSLSVLDVTQCESSDSALRDSEASYRRLFENVPDGVFCITENRKLLEGTRHWSRCWVMTASTN
jgi:PAS domain-containing protein